jgi:hypothetical protein
MAAVGTVSDGIPARGCAIADYKFFIVRAVLAPESPVFDDLTA